jgi:hypothetical protein
MVVCGQFEELRSKCLWCVSRIYQAEVFGAITNPYILKLATRMPQKGLAMKLHSTTTTNHVPCINLKAINNLDGFIFPED